MIVLGSNKKLMLKVIVMISLPSQYLIIAILIIVTKYRDKMIILPSTTHWNGSLNTIVCVSPNLHHVAGTSESNGCC